MIFAPRWQMQVLSGVLFGAAFGVLQLVQGAGGVEAVVIAALVGPFFGAFMGWFTYRQTQPLRDQLSSGRPNRRVRKAVLGGPLPQDPQERRTAGVLINYHLDQLLRTRRLNLVVFGLLIVGGILLAFNQPWTILVAVIGLANLLYAPWVLKRLRRQHALLEA